jgi:predicted PurR-regulated permease PerM
MAAYLKYVDLGMNKKIFTLFVVLLILGYAGWYFSGILFYVVFSVVLATVLRPIVNTITSIEVASLPIPRALAILMAYSSAIFLIVLFVLLFVPLISDQVEILSSLNYERAFQGMLEPVRQLEKFMIEKELTEESPGFIEDSMNQWLLNLVQDLDISAIFGQILSFTGNLFIGTMAVLFITTFLLYEQGILRRNFIALVPNRYFEIFINALHKIEKLLSNYLLGLLAQITIIFTMASIGLSIMDVKYAITIALFAAVANVIPYLGPIIGSTFGIVIGLIPSAMAGPSQDTLWLAIKIVSVFSVVQITDNVVVQPLVFSKSVKAHPLEIFVIIFVGATIAGIAGMIAAIPAYTIIRVSVSEFYRGSRRYRVFKTI